MVGNAAQSNAAAGKGANRQQRRQATRNAKKAGRPGVVKSQGYGGDVALSLQSALQSHQSGDLKTAEGLYRQILSQHPDHGDALHLLGLLAHQAGNNEAAAELIGRALTLNPKFAEAHNSLGAALQAQGQLDEALACYQRAAKIKPDYVEAHNNIGNVLKDQGKLDEAAKRFRRAMSLNPSYEAAHCNLGNLLSEQDELDKATTCYKKALAINPNLAEAHNALGAVLLKQDELDEAVIHYERALEIKPNYAEAHNNLGNAMKELGNHGKAIAQFQCAVDINPNFAEAHNGLGVALKDQGRFDEAIISCRRALDIDPKIAEAHYNLGYLLNQHSKIDEAIAHYKRVIEIEPTYAAAYNGLGFALKSKGQFDEATVAFEKALTIKPNYAPPYKELVSLRKIQPNDELISRIEKVLAEEKLSDRDKGYLYFALGKCFADIGEYDKAFDNYRAGNEIKKQTTPFNAAIMIDENSRIIETFTRSFLEKRAAFGNDSEQPIFIVGMPRSGTTLTEQIISSHAQVSGAGELANFNLMAVDLPRILQDGRAYPACATSIDKEIAGNLAQGYLDYLQSRFGDAARITDKMPANFRHLGLIALLFPRARIIHCRRNPLDIGLSCYFQDFSTQPFSHDLADIGLYYRQYERLMAHWRDCLPLPILDLQYEELIADKEKVSRRMIDFCGLDWDDACLASHKNDRQIHTASIWQARQPVYNTSIERWRRYEKHLGPLMDALGKEQNHEAFIDSSP